MQLIVATCCLRSVLCVHRFPEDFQLQSRLDRAVAAAWRDPHYRPFPARRGPAALVQSVPSLHCPSRQRCFPSYSSCSIPSRFLTCQAGSLVHSYRVLQALLRIVGRKKTYIGVKEIATEHLRRVQSCYCVVSRRHGTLI